MSKDLDIHNSLGYVVKRAGRALSNRIHQHIREKGLDITMQQGGILMKLKEQDGAPQQKLVAELCKDKTTIARIVDNMEKNSLIVRIPDKQDKRVKLIYLTQKGRAMQEQIQLAALETLKEGQKGISKSELNICIDVLHKVFNNLTDPGLVDDTTIHSSNCE